MMVSGAPSANASIAAKSKVVQSPEEQQAAYDAWLKSQLAQTNQLQSQNSAYNQSEKAYNDLWKAFALSGGAPEGYISPNVSPGIMQGPGVTDQVDGKTISRADLYWAHDQAAAARQAMKGGGSSYTAPVGLSPEATKALQAYQSSFRELPQVDAQGRVGDYGTAQHTYNMHDQRRNEQQLADSRTLGTQGVNSWNQFIQDTYNNTNANGQGYLDMLGGGFMGGINPWATNPSWSGTSAPQWQAPAFAGQNQLQGEAMQSPWGQAGAPFVQQAWAGGVTGQSPFTPTTSNPFAPAPTTGIGMAQQTLQEQQAAQNAPQQQPTFSGMFNPSSPSPQLATNAPWGSPYQNNGNSGAPPWFATPTANPGAIGQKSNTQQNPMTFGQSPWGSAW